MKKLTGMFFCVLFMSPVNSEGLFEAKVFECGLSGCHLDCVTAEGHYQRVGKAKSIEMSLLPNGATYFTLNQPLGKVSTVIVGSEGFLCKISGQAKPLRGHN